MTVLYTKQGEKLRQWQCFAEGAEVVVIHGQVGGKQTEKRYTAEPTNETVLLRHCLRYRLKQNCN